MAVVLLRTLGVYRGRCCSGFAFGIDGSACIELKHYHRLDTITISNSTIVKPTAELPERIYQFQIDGLRISLGVRSKHPMAFYTLNRLEK